MSARNLSKTRVSPFWKEILGEGCFGSQPQAMQAPLRTDREPKLN